MKKVMDHNRRMEEYNKEDEFDLTREMFSGALERIKKKNANKYAFILKGGQSLTEALFHLFKHVWSSETIPDGWKKTNIVQIYKGKHSRQDLSSYRNHYCIVMYIVIYIHDY